MANWSILKQAIADTIKTNGNQEITGQLLQNTLTSIVNSIGENATFAGVATPSTNPGVQDGNVFYFASTPGLYTNFSGITVGKDEFSILHNNANGWAKTQIFTNTDVDSIVNLGDFSSVDAAMNEAKKYSVVSNVRARIILWTHGNDAGIIFQMHIGREYAIQFVFFSEQTLDCKTRHLVIDLTNKNIIDRGWQELIMPTNFSYDKNTRTIIARGVNPLATGATRKTWSVATLPLADNTHSGLLSSSDKTKLDSVVDLGIVANINAASEKAAERTITENSSVRIIFWRTADEGIGDGGTIIQNRFGTYYVTQILLFEGQSHKCYYRLITTGGNYSVGSWQNLIIPKGIEYDSTTRIVNAINLNNSKQAIFTFPNTSANAYGLIKIGDGLAVDSTTQAVHINLGVDTSMLSVDDKNYLRVNIGKGLTNSNGNLTVRANTSKGLGFYKDSSLVVTVSKGINYDEITGGLCIKASKSFTFDENNSLDILLGTGLIKSDIGAIGVKIGTGLLYDYDNKIGIDIEYLKTALGL